MSGLSKPRNWGVGVVFGVLCVTSLYAQQRARPAPRGRVTQMEIFDGPRRTVRYFGDNISPGEASTLRDVERSENELSYLNDLQSLKNQYVTSERLMETHRRLVQQQLYGVQTTRSTYGSMAVGYGGYGGYGYYGYPSFGGYGYGGGLTATASDSASETRSLANGVGSEGNIKEAMAMVLAQQATPEYASKIDRAYDMALLRATSSPTLRVALGVPSTEDSLRQRSKDRLVDYEITPPGSVVLTLKDGQKLSGKKLREKGDWYILDGSDGSQEQIRQTEVVRIQRGKGTDGIVPAADR